MHLYILQIVVVCYRPILHYLEICVYCECVHYKVLIDLSAENNEWRNPEVDWGRNLQVVKLAFFDVISSSNV